MPPNNDAEIHKNGSYHNAPPFAELRNPMGRAAQIRQFLFKRTPNAVPAGNIPIVPLNRHDLETRRENDEIHLYRLGHSTVLLKLGADYWLTDPVFSNRASPSRLAGPKRFHNTPITIADLPDIKGVIISHNHYDHLDKSAIKQLNGKVGHFVTTRGTGKYLKRWGVAETRITELGWWQSHSHGDTTLTATPSQHFSGRGLFDNNKSLWASFVLQHNGRKIFFGSDSGYFDGFKQIGQHFGGFDITLMETGAYSALWPYVHMTPDQTYQAHKDLRGKTLMPIHNSTFKLAFHPWKEPLDRITELAEQENTPLLTPQIGERITLGQTASTPRWWQSV